MTPSHRTRWLVAAIVVVVLGLTFRPHGYPLLDPDEGRNAEIAREMAVSNNYVIPHLNGLPYLDKPVLFFAVGAVFMKILGPTELAARLPSLLFTLVTLALVGWFGRSTMGKHGGLIAVVATGATPLTLAFSRTVIFDSALTCFVVLAIVAFYRASEIPRADGSSAARERAAWWITAAWASLALGVLTKGPIALAVPLMIMGPYLAWRRRLDALWDTVGVLLFVAIVLPWIVLMSREVPDFLEYTLVVETAQRLTTDRLQRSEPFWYFFPILLAGALPWSFVVLMGWKGGRPTRDEDGRWDRRLVLTLLWVLVPLVFFTLSQSKRPQYMLPLIPGLGLMAALLWSGRGDTAPGARGAGIGLAAVGGLIALAPTFVPRLLPLDPGVAAAIPKTAVALGLVCFGAGVVTTLYAARKHVAVLALAIPVATIPFVSATIMDAIGRDRSSRELARAIEPNLAPETAVVAVHTYPLSLPFYLRRSLLLVTADGSELTSNFLARTFDRWAEWPNSPFRPDDWWLARLTDCRRPTVFVVRSDDQPVRQALRSRVPLIAETGKAAAYGPCGTTDLARAAHPPRRARPPT